MPKPMRDEGRPEDSFAALLFREYSQGLHSFLVRRMGSAQDVEDVLQTVFERLVRIKKVDLVQKPHDYLFGIAFHVVREFWMRTKRDQVVTVDSRAIDEAGESLAHAHPDDSAERLNLRRQLERALAELPEADRVVLLARFRDGMQYKEIAEATGISVDMVHKILIRAKARITARAWDR